MSLYVFLSPFASSILVFSSSVLLTAQAPAVEQVAVDFHETNTTILSLLVSIFVLAFAIGPLVAAPASELFGRCNLFPLI